MAGINTYLCKLNEIILCERDVHFFFAIPLLYNAGHQIFWHICDVPTMLYLLQVFLTLLNALNKIVPTLNANHR